MPSLLARLFEDLAADVISAYQQFRGRLKSLHVTLKPDQTVLTEADLTIQKLVVDRVRAAIPGVGVIAEEEDVRHENTRGLGDFWILDPIDGTREFVRPDRSEF